MTIEQYIEETRAFDMMPHRTVYETILQLIRDGYISERDFVEREHVERV